jgi:hypothetical protein
MMLWEAAAGRRAVETLRAVSILDRTGRAEDREEIEEPSPEAA